MFYVISGRKSHFVIKNSCMKEISYLLNSIITVFIVLIFIETLINVDLTLPAVSLLLMRLKQGIIVL